MAALTRRDSKSNITGHGWDYIRKQREHASKARAVEEAMGYKRRFSYAEAMKQAALAHAVTGFTAGEVKPHLSQFMDPSHTFVWIPDGTDAWLPARVLDGDPLDLTSELTVDVKPLGLGMGGARTILGKERARCQIMLATTGSHIVSNLVNLEEVSEAIIIHQLRERFKDDAIYTYVGSVLCALNPFFYLPIYRIEDMDMYVKIQTQQPAGHRRSSVGERVMNRASLFCCYC